MKIRDWQDLLNDIVEEDVDSSKWKAIAGKREKGIGEDFYLGHPSTGLFQFKIYAKNPFEVKGVGSKLSKNIDEEINSNLPKSMDSGHFSVHKPLKSKDEAKEKAEKLEDTIKSFSKHRNQGETKEQGLFTEMMKILESPAFGPLTYNQGQRPESINDLSSTFQEEQKELQSELEKLLDKDKIGRGFI